MNDASSREPQSTPPPPPVADRQCNGTRLVRVPGGSLTGKATGPAMLMAARLRTNTLDQISRDPARLQAIQHSTLLAHCQRGADTEFGRQHGLGRVASAEDYRQAVPLRPYAEFEPYLERMRRGERNILHPEFIEYYGCSSGTSDTAAKNKYLPVSREQIGWQQKAGFDIAARYLQMTGDSEFTGGFVLYLFPPAVIRKEGPVGISSNPGLMLLHLPRVSRLLSLPKPPLRDIENYDRKLDAIADTYLSHDVRVMSGTTCWFSNLFDRLLMAARRRGMSARTISDIWPNLRVLFGGGVHAEPYREIIAQRVGRKIPIIDNYNATEGGVFAVSDRLDDPGMAMIPDRGVYFEFVPREQHGRPDARRFALWEVEAGVEYSVVVTTCSGLYAYYMGDFIRFTSVYPHRIEFTGRASGVLSITQELVTFLEIERAVRHALQETGSAAVEFSCGAEIGISDTAKGRYQLFIEFESTPADLQAFAQSFDSELCLQNRVYREHRQSDVAILPPQVVALPPGAMRKFVERIGRNGPQQKFPHIVDDAKRDVLRGLGSVAAST